MINKDWYIALHSDALLFSADSPSGDSIQHHQEEGNHSIERQGGQPESEW